MSTVPWCSSLLPWIEVRSCWRWVVGWRPIVYRCWCCCWVMCWGGVFVRIIVCSCWFMCWVAGCDYWGTRCPPSWAVYYLQLPDGGVQFRNGICFWVSWWLFIFKHVISPFPSTISTVLIHWLYIPSFLILTNWSDDTVISSDELVCSFLSYSYALPYLVSIHDVLVRLPSHCSLSSLIIRRFYATPSHFPSPLPSSSPANYTTLSMSLPETTMTICCGYSLTTRLSSSAVPYSDTITTTVCPYQTSLYSIDSWSSLVLGFRSGSVIIFFILGPRITFHYFPSAYPIF